MDEKLLQDARSLSALDCLQSCPLLKELSLSGPGFQGLEMPSAFFSSLEPLLVNKLKVISLESIALNSSAAEELSRSLQSQYCSLVTLILRRCRLLSNASKLLAIGINRNTSLHRIAFLFCQLNSADFEVLADALRDNKTLEQVVLLEQETPLMIDKAVSQH